MGAVVGRVALLRMDEREQLQGFCLLLLCLAWRHGADFVSLRPQLLCRHFAKTETLGGSIPSHREATPMRRSHTVIASHYRDVASSEKCCLLRMRMPLC